MSTHATFPPGYLEEYSGRKLINVATTFLVIDIVFVALRFYCRYLAKRKLRWDDWLMIPSLMFCLGSIAVAYYAVAEAAVGRHVAYAIIHKDKFINWYKSCLLVMPVMYGITGPLPKFAILALYLQILQDKPSRYIAYATIAGLLINSCITVPLCVFRCSTISYGWEHILDPHLTGGWCVNLEPRFRWPGIACIVTDIVIMVLPIPLIRRLTHSRATQVGVAVIFALGSIGIVASCMRFAAFFATAALKDGTWASVELLSWCIAEPSICLVAACLLAFKPLMVKLVQNPVVSHITSKFNELRRSRKQRSSETSNSDSSTIKGWPHIPVSKVSDDSTICDGRGSDGQVNASVSPTTCRGEGNARKCSCSEKQATTVKVRERLGSHDYV